MPGLRSTFSTNLRDISESQTRTGRLRSGSDGHTIGSSGSSSASGSTRRRPPAVKKKPSLAESLKVMLNQDIVREPRKTRRPPEPRRGNVQRRPTYDSSSESDSSSSGWSSNSPSSPQLPRPIPAASRPLSTRISAIVHKFPYPLISLSTAARNEAIAKRRENYEEPKGRSGILVTIANIFGNATVSLEEAIKRRTLRRSGESSRRWHVEKIPEEPKPEFVVSRMKAPSQARPEVQVTQHSQTPPPSRRPSQERPSPPASTAGSSRPSRPSPSRTPPPSAAAASRYAPPRPNLGHVPPPPPPPPAEISQPRSQGRSTTPPPVKPPRRSLPHTPGPPAVPPKDSKAPSRSRSRSAPRKGPGADPEFFFEVASVPATPVDERPKRDMVWKDALINRKMNGHKPNALRLRMV